MAYTRIGSGGAGRAAGNFLRYVQYRDKHLDAPPRDVDAVARYVAHRDRSVGRGLMFGPDGPAADPQRRELVDHIRRSIKGVPPPARRHAYSDRACYRLVISPAEARGLDLQAVTRSALDTLGRELGPSGLPPWIAAEHRNTAHPHVHVVLAARREISPGRYRGVLITRARLQRMKEAVDREIVHQRGDRERVWAGRREHLGRSRRRPRLQSHLARFARHQLRAADEALREYEQETERELERTVEVDLARRGAVRP